MRDSWKRFLSLAFTAALLALLLFLYGDRRLLDAFKGIDLASLAMGVALVITVLLFGVTDRWRRIVRVGGTKISFAEAWRMRLGGAPLKIVTPMRVSEILRAPYLTQRHGTPAATAIGIVAFEKAVILIGVAPVLSLWVFVAVATGVVMLATREGRYIVLVAVGRLGPKWRERTEQLLTAFAAAGFGGTMKWIAYSTLLNVGEAAALAFCLRAVGVDLPFVDWLTVLPVVLLVAMGSFTVGGLGAREAVLVLLFPALDPHGLMAGGVVFFVVAKVGVALLGLIWLPGYLKGMIAR